MIKQLQHSREIPEAAAILASAFEQDPVLRWLINDEKHWQRAKIHFFNEMLKPGLAHGEIYKDADNRGAAIWYPPNPSQPGFWSNLTSSLRLAKVFGRHALKGLKIEELMKQHHPIDAHWYLHFLGAGQQFQGQGVGSQLLQKTLTKCDEMGANAYLESSNEANIGLYMRFGFKVTGEMNIPGGPTIWPMWRDANEQ